jgi:hypothetical protein
MAHLVVTVSAETPLIAHLPRSEYNLVSYVYTFRRFVFRRFVFRRFVFRRFVFRRFVFRHFVCRRFALEPSHHSQQQCYAFPKKPDTLGGIQTRIFCPFGRFDDYCAAPPRHLVVRSKLGST